MEALSLLHMRFTRSFPATHDLFVRCGHPLTERDERPSWTLQGT